ncbi:MAG TPA: MarR family transcriptional regulator [Rudaea sp.]|nr:MarR family transcriptional regulator [Rudaea sp.]
MSEPRQPATEDLAERLHSAAIRLLRRARRDDAAMGLPPGQASALSVLVFGGARTLGELAAIEQVRAPTMTRMVDALERAGYARREADAEDRRKLRIVATAAGVRLMRQGRARRVRVLVDALSGLSRDERATLAAAIAILERLPPHREPA